MSEKIHSALAEFPKESRSEFNKKYLNQVEILIENTWFVTNDKEKWATNMLDLYYPEDNRQLLYHLISDRGTEKGDDLKFLYRLMKAVHYAYYSIPELRLKIPEKHVQELKLKYENMHNDVTEFPHDGKIFHTGREILEYHAKIKSEKG
jgi:hypothetical protein